MAEFCTCGSLIINDQCTNKNCSNKTTTKSASSKQSGSKATSSDAKKPKSGRVKRASKCITYNLYEDKNEESSIEE